MAIWKEGKYLGWYAELGNGLNLSVLYNPKKLDPDRPYEAQVFGYHTTRAATREEAQQAAERIAREALSQALAALDAKDDGKDGETMSNDTTPHTPADVRERVAKIVREAMEDAGRSERLNTFVQNSMWDYTDRILAILHTPRGEGEASGLAECIITCMGCGQDFDANDDAQARYHEAACEVVDHEPARVEIARRLRGAALRSEAQGDAEALAALVVRIWTRCKNEGPHYRESDEFWADFERAYQLAAHRDGAQRSEASAPYAYIGVEETWDADSRSVTVYERVLWDRDSATRWQAERPEDRIVTPVYHRPAAHRGEGGGE